MTYGHDGAPSEEHKAHQAVLAVPESRTLAQPWCQGCSVAHCSTQKPDPPPSSSSSWPSCCRSSSPAPHCFLWPGDAPPCTAPLPWYPAMFYPLFHRYLPAQKAGAYLLAKDFLLGSWRQIIMAVSNNV